MGPLTGNFFLYLCSLLKKHFFCILGEDLQLKTDHFESLLKRKICRIQGFSTRIRKPVYQHLFPSLFTSTLYGQRFSVNIFVIYHVSKYFTVYSKAGLAFSSHPSKEGVDVKCVNLTSMNLNHGNSKHHFLYNPPTHTQCHHHKHFPFCSSCLV